MMKLFAVRDVVSDSFGAPMSITNRGIAMRSFSDACLNPKSDLARYPESYMLYELAEYDPNSGTITPHQLPVLVCTASAAIAKAKEIVAEEVTA